MSTLTPRPAYTPAELAKLYPADLELQQVQILLRHGERTPVNTRFRNAGLAPFWPYCSAAKAMRSAILNADGTLDSLQWRRRLESLGEGDAPKLNAGPNGEVDGICQPGELTDRGRETTLALGQRVRKLYVEQLAFLPSTLSSQSSVYLRSTPIPRALESVQQAFTGLYPPASRSPALAPLTIVTRSMQDETLFPNEGACKRFGELARAFADRTAQLYNDGPELRYINKKIGKWMPETSPVVKVDSHPRLSGVMDSVNATLAHAKETKLPSEFYDQKVRDDIDKVCTEEWFVGYMESNEYRKLGIGAMVGDLVQTMVEHISTSQGGNSADANGSKMSLNGCHDTTIAGTLTALGAMDATKDKWPGFTSNIAFELFKRKDNSPYPSHSPSETPPTTTGALWPPQQKTWWSSLFSSLSPQSPQTSPTTPRTPLTSLPTSEQKKLDNYYVRLRYNDNPITIPFCKPSERHFSEDETFCTFAAFKEAVDSFTPRDWRKECASHLGEAAMRPQIERPPGL